MIGQLPYPGRLGNGTTIRMRPSLWRQPGPRAGPRTPIGALISARPALAPVGSFELLMTLIRTGTTRWDDRHLHILTYPRSKYLKIRLSVRQLPTLFPKSLLSCAMLLGVVLSEMVIFHFVGRERHSWAAEGQVTPANLAARRYQFRRGLQLRNERKRLFVRRGAINIRTLTISTCIAILLFVLLDAIFATHFYSFISAFAVGILTGTASAMGARTQQTRRHRIRYLSFALLALASAGALINLPHFFLNRAWDPVLLE